MSDSILTKVKFSEDNVEYYDTTYEIYKNYTKLLNVQERCEKVEPMLFIHIPLNEYVDAYK